MKTSIETKKSINQVASELFRQSLASTKKKHKNKYQEFSKVKEENKCDFCSLLYSA